MIVNYLKIDYTFAIRVLRAYAVSERLQRLRWK